MFKFKSALDAAESEVICSDVQVEDLAAKNTSNENPVFGPEHIEATCTGDLYVGSTKTGELFMLTPRDPQDGSGSLTKEWEVTTVAKLNRALGIKSILLEMVAENEFVETLLVCDTMCGIQEVKIKRVYDPTTDSFKMSGEPAARVILKEVEGKPINFANGITMAEHDQHLHVFVSDSTRNTSYGLITELLSHPSGRIIHFDYTAFCQSSQSTADTMAKAVASNMSFVNGLHVFSCTHEQVQILYVETHAATVSVLTWSPQANTYSTDIKWSGPFLWDNLVPVSPAWPKGSDLIAALSPRSKSFMSRFDKLPSSHYLIAAPSQVTAKVSALMTASKIAKNTFSWIPGFPFSLPASPLSYLMSSQAPPGAFALYDTADHKFQTVFLASPSSADKMGALSHACVADVIDTGATLRALIVCGSYDGEKQLRCCVAEFKKCL